MNYGTESLRVFIIDRIGAADAERMWPIVDRLISLYQEYRKVSGWLESNEDALGQKDYKEYVATMNGLQANILKLEDKLDLYRIRRGDDDANDVLDSVMGN